MNRVVLQVPLEAGDPMRVQTLWEGVMPWDGELTITLPDLPVVIGNDDGTPSLLVYRGSIYRISEKVNS